MITTTLGIDGMMCSMCEAHVQDAVRKAADVKRVKANHSKGTCVIESESPLDEQALSQALGATGYKVLSFSQEEGAKKRGFLGLF